MKRQERMDSIAYDCIYFQADGPCTPHRQCGDTCRCAAYRPASGTSLIIELTDAVRTIHLSALIGRIKRQSPDQRVWVLCRYPELLAGSEADRVMSPEPGTIAALQATSFTMIYNVDNHLESAGLMNMLFSESRKGFYVRNGHVDPIDDDAQGAYLAEMFPCSDTKGSHADANPVRDLLQCCGMTWQNERPMLGGYGRRNTWPVGIYPGNDLGNSDAAFGQWNDLQNHLAQAGIDVVPLWGPDNRADAAVIAGQAFVDPGDHWVRHFGDCQWIITGSRLGAELAMAMRKNVILTAKPKRAMGSDRFVAVTGPHDSTPDVEMLLTTVRDALGCSLVQEDRDAMESLGRIVMPSNLRKEVEVH